MRTRVVTHDLIDRILEGFLCQLLNLINYIFNGESFGWQWVPLGSLNSQTAPSMREMFWQRTGTTNHEDVISSGVETVAAMATAR